MDPGVQRSNGVIVVGKDRRRNIDRVDRSTLDQRLKIVEYLGVDILLKVANPQVWRTERVTGSLTDGKTRLRTFTPLAKHFSVFATTRHEGRDPEIVVASLTKRGIPA
jgi:hypothetical protein